MQILVSLCISESSTLSFYIQSFCLQADCNFDGVTWPPMNGLRSHDERHCYWELLLESQTTGSQTTNLPEKCHLQNPPKKKGISETKTLTLTQRGRRPPLKEMVHQKKRSDPTTPLWRSGVSGASNGSLSNCPSYIDDSWWYIVHNAYVIIYRGW